MGDNPRDSVVDHYHRAHDVPNLFLIQALAYRATDHIVASAKRGEI